MKQILKRPIITEKSLALAARGWYTFMVDDTAAKNDIARAITSFYKVTVTNVRTLTMHGKVRRAGKLMRATKKPDWKKAMVQLVKGEKIDAFEVTEQQGEKSAKG